MSMLDHPRREGEFLDWEKLYQTEPVESMPWYTPHLDPDLEQALKEFKINSGHFLDLGTGPGTQAALLAGMGFRVTASDLSGAALGEADKLARQRGVCIAFVEDNILTSELEGPFDYIFDRGCFHTLPPEQREIYVNTVHHLLSPNGKLFLKCFSVLESSERGPYRFSPQMIQTLFASRFQILTSRESHFEGTLPEKPKALFNIMVPLA
ncbi:MAG: class I SAM-dependent methyltransferase [Magnetococcus sp. DMHC-6]